MVMMLLCWDMVLEEGFSIMIASLHWITSLPENRARDRYPWTFDDDSNSCLLYFCRPL